MILCWAAFTAILGCMLSMGCRSDPLLYTESEMDVSQLNSMLSLCFVQYFKDFLSPQARESSLCILAFYLGTTSLYKGFSCVNSDFLLGILNELSSSFFSSSDILIFVCMYELIRRPWNCTLRSHLLLWAMELKPDSS